MPICYLDACVILGNNIFQSSLEIRPQFADDAYKCIVSRIPKATIALFLRDKKGKLEFKGIEKEENYRDIYYRNIFQAFGSGDSGGPISVKVYDANLNFGSSSETKCFNCFKSSQMDKHIGGKRHVIVAVMAAGIGIKKTHHLL